MLVIWPTDMDGRGRAAYRPKVEKVPLNVLTGFNFSDKLLGQDLLTGMRWDSLQKSSRANEFAWQSGISTHIFIHRDMDLSRGVCVCGGGGYWEWRMKRHYGERYFRRERFTFTSVRGMAKGRQLLFLKSTWGLCIQRSVFLGNVTKKIYTSEYPTLFQT